MTRQKATERIHIQVRGNQSVFQHRMETLMPKKHQNALGSIRKASGLTQLQVAGALGVSKATYSSWEVGRAEMGADRLVALSDLFGCTPNDIIGYRSSSSQFSVLSTPEEECITLFRLLPPNIREDIMDIMRSTVKVWRLR